MTKRERSWNLFYSVVLVIFASIPYFLGYFTHGDTWQFTGFVFGVEDGNSYIAKMLLGSRGDWLFRTPYTSLPQSGVVAFLPYLLLGKFAAGVAIHEQMVALFHLFRVFATPIAVFATYQFVSLFVTSIWWRRWATILATAGGGLGWFLILIGNSPWLGSLPLDFYSPETFGFLSYYGLPHLILARAFLLFGLSFYLQSIETTKSGWIAGMFFLGLVLVQPITILPAYAMITIHLVLLIVKESRGRNWQNIKPWLGAGLKILLLSSPVVIYLGYSFTQDPFLSAWTSQNLILSPNPLHYVIAYGLIMLPTVMGIRRVVLERNSRGLLLLGWVILFPLLAYAPFNLQRRLPEGIWVALLSLAAIGLQGWLGDNVKIERWVGRFLLSFGLLSSLLLIAAGMDVAIRPKEPAFRKFEEVEAFSWLNEEAEPNSVVLAAFHTGNALPAWAPVRVVIGHGPESVDLEELEPQVDAFYDEKMTDAERLQFIRSHDVQYVWYGPRENALGSWNPARSDFLTLAYSYADYKIYSVQSSHE
ncbi:MAG: hypothetical protein AMJ88_00900 [Anaerolineae bacterium SM23_ 63]|nr:MAG: hypothetical protein AMJ88_00900 [Anaerolineae bacterium SM23_ 63]HEY47919.1 hypothetical protein [Anaerolineae bacterium]